MDTTVARIREADDETGFRVLVDRLWPRGISKERAHVDLWAKDVAPSTDLRRWYHDDREARHDEFVTRYRAELDDAGHDELLGQLREQDDLVLLTDAKDVEGSHVLVLVAWLHRHHVG